MGHGEAGVMGLELMLMLSTRCVRVGGRGWNTGTGGVNRAIGLITSVKFVLKLEFGKGARDW